MAKKPKPCRVREGRFVDPCDTLNKLVGRAVEHRQLVNLKTLEPARSFVLIKSGEFQDNGIVMNCCPFCGTRIDAPVEADSQAA